MKIKIKEIKDKLENRMTELEQYTELLKLEDKLLFFNQYNEVNLVQSDYVILKELYKVYYNKFSALNVTCASCVSEMLNICISRHSALKKQFDKVAEPAPLENAEVDNDGIITMIDTFQPPSIDFKKELRDAVEADKLLIGRFEPDLEYLEKCFKSTSARLETQDLDYLEGFLKSVDAKLNNESFVQNAKPEIIANERNKKADAEAKIEEIKAKMAIESEIKKATKKKTK